MQPPPTSAALLGAAASTEHPGLGAVAPVPQCEAPAAGVIPLPRGSSGALHVSIQAFNTLFCDFCLGSNEA